MVRQRLLTNPLVEIAGHMGAEGYRQLEGVIHDDLVPLEHRSHVLRAMDRPVAAARLDRVTPELEAALLAQVDLMDASPFRKAVWLVSPNPHFDGRAPIELLREGQRDRVYEW